MTYFGLITFIHTALSLLALLLGIFAVRELFLVESPGTARRVFLALATATSVTGFFFPFKGMTPAIVTGIIALLVLAAVRLASRRGLECAWRLIYASGVVASLYLLVFVAIVQAFLKIPPLHELAPTGSELPLILAQLYALGLFVSLGILAGRRFAPGSNTRRHPLDRLA